MDCGIVGRNAWFGEARRGRWICECVFMHSTTCTYISSSHIPMFLNTVFFLSLALCCSHLLFEPKAQAPSKCRAQQSNKRQWPCLRRRRPSRSDKRFTFCASQCFWLEAERNHNAMEMRRSHVAGKVRHLRLHLLGGRSRSDGGVVDGHVSGAGVSVSWV
jgi:hypothetical protein